MPFSERELRDMNIVYPCSCPEFTLCYKFEDGSSCSLQILMQCWGIICSHSPHLTDDDDDGQIPHQESKCLQVITIFFLHFLHIFFLVISLSSGTAHLRSRWGSDNKEGRYASNDNNREGIAHCVYCVMDVKTRCTREEEHDDARKV